MPGGDQTGPMGMGARTGRSAGYCSGYEMAGYLNPVPRARYGLGFGAGRGFIERGGRGWRNWYHATGLPGWRRFGGYVSPSEYPLSYMKLDPELEKRSLKYQADALQAELEYIKKRLEEFEAEAATD